MFRIIVTGDRACFTRPESKVERVSYPVPTPSALVGLLKSVYWKPAIRYVIDKIVVFNEIKFANIRRNEVSAKVLYSAVKNRMRGGDKDPALYTKECINQRATSLLQDVRYGVGFHFELTGVRSERGEETDGKHAEIIARRLAKGQYFRQPCLGCSEFPVKSIVRVDEFDPAAVDDTLKGDVDLGFMLYAMRYNDDPQHNDEWRKECFKDDAEPIFYHPHMIDGIIDVEKYAKEVSE